MDIRTYNDIETELIRWTHSPAELVDIAAQHCMKQPENIGSAKANDRLITYLLEAEHENPFEHVVYTFRVNGLSRSGMAQLIRHRIASYTFTSQHYQTYSDYPFVIHPDYDGLPEWFEVFNACLKAYDQLLLRGVPKEEARQVLPNAMSTGFVMTINARSLVNFLRLRLCKRNCAEIMALAWSMRRLAITHFPELFNQVHTMCVMDGKCNQGAMSCGEPYQKD